MKYYYIREGLGDILYGLPTIKALGGGYIINGLPIEHHRALKPLMACQPYVKGFYHESEYGLPKGFINLGDFLHLQKNPRHIIEAFASVMNVQIDLKEPWLEIPKIEGWTGLSYAVMNITPRYRDKLFNYKKEIRFLRNNTQSPICFLGTYNEYMYFTEKYSREHIRYVKTDNLLEAAQIIAGAKYFTGTQSSLLAIAEGLGRSYRYERSPFHDNCRTGRDNETILNNHTRKWHLALSRTQEIYRNFTS
jgi:hypothetical protein